MNVLKAYADAGAMGQQNFGPMALPRPEQRAARPGQKPSRSGDSISLSEEARTALESGGRNVSVMPQDATYDRQGNVLRQVDNLQSDLRALASQFIGESGATGVMSRLGSMQSQIAGLRAQV